MRNVGRSVVPISRSGIKASYNNNMLPMYGAHLGT
jgi:hypothetical protein